MVEKYALIVDDEEDICRLLAAYLRKFFSKVEYALSISEGLNLAKEMSPSLLILDNNLPDGIGILKIEEFKKYCKQIIVISAMSNLNEQAIEAGANHFFMKPLSFKDFDLVVN